MISPVLAGDSHARAHDSPAQALPLDAGMSLQRADLKQFASSNGRELHFSS
jgi:hypothetical protein